MKCPKCGYTSFPYLDNCRKCGHGLAEVRKFLGVYAWPPNPPDLMLAYEALQADPMDTTAAEITPAGDLRQLEGIELDLANGLDTARLLTEQPASADPSQDIFAAFGLDTEQASPRHSPALTSGESGDEEAIELDLDDLEGLTIELREVPEEEATKISDVPSIPTTTAAEEPIFDLDDDQREPPPEYILEIDEELELEVDELEATDDEDDDDPDR